MNPDLIKTLIDTLGRAAEAFELMYGRDDPIVRQTRGLVGAITELGQQNQWEPFHQDGAHREPPPNQMLLVWNGERVAAAVYQGRRLWYVFGEADFGSVIGWHRLPSCPAFE